MRDTDLKNTRMTGWYKLPRRDRVSGLAGFLNIPGKDFSDILDSGGLDVDTADRLIENVAGVYSLPFAVAPNFLINGRDILVPMVTEEPSVVAAASNAARMIREGGGFNVSLTDPIMICQIQLIPSTPPEIAGEEFRRTAMTILSRKDEILAAAADVDPALKQAGGGPVDLEVREILNEKSGPEFLVVHLLVDVRDAMGANAVNTMGERIAPILEEISGFRAGLKVLSNLADKRTVRVEVSIPVSALEMKDYPGERVRDGIVSASRFAELDPYRAATHNKGIMNGVDAVIIAAGNDWRAVEAGAHAFAARGGRYMPLCTWRKDDDGALKGRLEMPMAVGTIGGAVKVHPAARLSLQIMGATGAGDLACVAASAGMANNLAALRALATEGIQRGHMKMHARSRIN